MREIIYGSRFLTSEAHAPTMVCGKRGVVLLCVWVAGFLCGFLSGLWAPTYFYPSPSSGSLHTHEPWGPVRRRYQVNFQGNLDDF